MTNRTTLHHVSAPRAAVFASVLIVILGAAGLLDAWSVPQGLVPSGNALSPIHAGSTDQVKDGGISLNALSVFGSGYVADRLGVKIANPLVALDIGGAMRPGYAGESCTGSIEGALRYVEAIGEPEYCNGTAWTPLLPSAVVPGSQSYTTPGTYTFSVPAFNTLSVIVSAGGGGGGGSPYCPGRTMIPGSSGGVGGTSSFAGGVFGYGGSGGGGGAWNGSNGAAGSAAGGDTNTAGGGASGGAGGVWGRYSGGRGGNGGLSTKTYNSDSFSVGSQIAVVVGSGGSGGGGCSSGASGASGSVVITWQ